MKRKLMLYTAFLLLACAISISFELSGLRSNGIAPEVLGQSQSGRRQTRSNGTRVNDVSKVIKGRFTGTIDLLAPPTAPSKPAASLPPSQSAPPSPSSPPVAATPSSAPVTAIPSIVPVRLTSDSPR